jgi:hypothetical protein
VRTTDLCIILGRLVQVILVYKGMIFCSEVSLVYGSRCSVGLP